MSVISEMFHNLLSKPVTLLYPLEKVPVPGAFRGRITIDDDKCIGCSKCSLICPAHVITMVENEREVEFKDKKLKRKKKPRVKLFKCIRCGLCERHCPTTPAAIYLKNELSDSGTNPEAMVT
jgi:formate hydrogenlyase subunit 6/NADH:ubiquinone oxidoreductase subunit I